LFKLEGDDELLFVVSKKALIEALESLIFSDEDLLIDTLGGTFKIRMDSEGDVVLTSLGLTLTLAEVTSLIQAHEFASTQACLTKIQFNSISEAVQALRSLN
jgi:hypothetical protein